MPPLGEPTQKLKIDVHIYTLRSMRWYLCGGTTTQHTQDSLDSNTRLTVVLCISFSILRMGGLYKSM